MTKSMSGWSKFFLRHIPGPLFKEPFALWLAIVCMVSGGLQLIGIEEPGSISSLLPRLVLMAWNIELFFGGLLTIVGILTSRARILILGLQPLGLAAAAYAVALIYVAGWRGVFPALITFAFSQACFLKAFTYSVALRSLADRSRSSEGGL